MFAFTQVVSKNIVLRSKGLSGPNTCLQSSRAALPCAVALLSPRASLLQATKSHNVVSYFRLALLPVQAARPGRTIAAADYQPTAPRNRGSFLLTNSVRTIVHRNARIECFLKSYLLLSTYEVFEPDHTALAFARELHLFRSGSVL
jgi:hypothetical protein